MAGKSLYKRAVDQWNEDVKFAPRAKESKMFEKTQSDKVGHKNKSKSKGLPRSNHKHDYQPIIVWRESLFKDRIYGYVGCRCATCGKIEKSYSTLFGGKTVTKYLGELEHFWKNEKDELVPIDKKTYQKTIFLGGSKIINKLPLLIEEEIVALMNLGHNILIGDCMGADQQMQKILAKNNYQKVVVYYSGDRPRFNLGNWQTKQVVSNKFMTDYERQKLKDNQMAFDCDYGYMLLAALTKGTMANVEKLVSLNKTCQVVLFNSSCVCISSSTIKTEKNLETLKMHFERLGNK